MQHLSANTEGPKRPQEVETALYILVTTLSLTFPVLSVVHVNTQISVVLHYPNLFTQAENNSVLFRVLLKATVLPFVLFTFKMR